MAITKCKECGAEVSTKAKECPKCGAPVKRKTSVVTWVAAIILGLWVIGHFASGPSTSTPVSNAAKIEPTPKETAINLKTAVHSVFNPHFPTPTYPAVPLSRA